MYATEWELTWYSDGSIKLQLHISENYILYHAPSALKNYCSIPAPGHGPSDSTNCYLQMQYLLNPAGKPGFPIYFDMHPEGSSMLFLSHFLGVQ
jgi:hypothetical protein